MTFCFRLFAAVAVLAAACSGSTLAQSGHPMDHPATSAGTTVPKLPGQDAFGAIQEIVEMLNADPKTDWLKVDLETLRQHLIDMNEVTLKAVATAKAIDGGVEVGVTGDGRTLAAIQRMLPAWAATMNGHNGWSTKAVTLPNRGKPTFPAADPKKNPHTRGLGVFVLPLSRTPHPPPPPVDAKARVLHGAS